MSNKQSSEERRSSLDRGLAVLNFLGNVQDASIVEMTEATGISRSAAYRLIERLEEHEYLVSVSPGRWNLGPAAARLAMSAVSTVDLMDVAPEMIRALAKQTRETVGLGALSGDEMIFVYRESGPQAVRVSAELGARRPLHASSIGKAYLSGLESSERATLLRQLDLRRYTKNTIVQRAELEQDIADAQNRGWTEEHAEFDENSMCCGAPIFDHSGKVIAAISVAGLTSRMEGQFSKVGPLVSATAAAISRGLGWMPRHSVKS